MPSPSYAQVANCRLISNTDTGVVNFSGDRNMRFDTRLAHDFTTRIASFRAGSRITYTLWDSTALGTDRLYHESNRPIGFRRKANLDTEVNFTPHPNFYLRNTDVWLLAVELRFSGRTMILRPDFPIHIELFAPLNYRRGDTKYLYDTVDIAAQVMPLSADMFELAATFTPSRPTVPVYVDIPSNVGGQGDGDTSHRFPNDVDTLRLSGYVDNRQLAVWNFSYVTPNSLPVKSVHAHFEPFVGTTQQRELERMGISVYIDEFGLVHFPSFQVYEAYLRAFITGEKFNREWLHARDAAKQNYAQVAANLPDNFIASKGRMASAYAAAVGSEAYDRALSRYRDPEVLADLHGKSLDAIVELNQEKVAKVVRSVEKKRTLASRLDGILNYYRTSPDSTVTLPSGLSEKVIRSLVSQPLSKIMSTLDASASDAFLAEAIATDLIERLGFTRRVA